VALLAIALVLLPGLLVVRAPWTAVPALSLAFWTLSAWWPPLAGLGRSRVLLAVLVTSFLLALLRLVPQHAVEPPPGWQPPPTPAAAPRPGLPSPPIASAWSLVVLAASLVLAGTAVLSHHAPGPRLAFQTTITRLLVWRDGIPASGEPLLPLEPVGAHSPALATLAADVAQLAGIDAAPALLWVVTAAAGLLLVGLFSLHATWAPLPAAAVGTLLGLAIAPLPRFLSACGEGEAWLALGFLLPAAALVLAHASRSSAVAAAMLLAAGALAQPLLAAGVAASLVGVSLLRRPRGTGRTIACLALALALAAPGLLPLARALSAREALLALQSPRPAELARLALGLLLAGLAPLVLRRVRPSSRAGRVALGALALAAVGLLVVRLHHWVASGQLPEPVRTALARAGREAGPLEPLCPPPGLSDWIPALAARPSGDPGPWIPPVYAEEWARRPRRFCSHRLESLLARP
jgi:hypothetical protein